MNIEKEFESFFEFPTDDKSQVSSTSCKLFAEHVMKSLRTQLTDCEENKQEPYCYIGYGMQAYEHKPFEDATPLYIHPSQDKIDAERWRYFVETCSEEAAFELTGITGDVSNEEINEAIDHAMSEKD